MAKFPVNKRLQLFNESHKAEINILLNGLSFLEFEECGLDEEDSNDSVVISVVGEDKLVGDGEFSETFEEKLERLESSNSDMGKEAGLQCNTCNLKFIGLAEQRQHFHMDWHRYNLKRKFFNQPPVNEDEFRDMMDGLSSISGSEEEDSLSSNQLSRLIDKVTLDGDDVIVNIPENKSELVLKKTCKAFFKTNSDDVIAFYEAIIPFKGVKNNSAASEKVIPFLREIVQSNPIWCIVMLSGGHFAAGIFNGTTEVAHKTFHSYTVRAKQGGAQGSKDAKSGTSHPKSAGASLRRYNEQSFNQHVQELLASWKEKLDKCQRIFYRAVSSNQNILFGGQNPPLSKTDTRLKTIPFQTKRPTFSEVKRVLTVLNTIEVLGHVDAFKALLMKRKRNRPSRSRPAAKTIDRAKSRSPVKREEPPVQIPTSEENSDLEFENVTVDTVIDLKNQLEEFQDSLTPAQRVIKKRKKKPKSKASDFCKPTGSLGALAAALERKDLDAISRHLKNLILEFKDDTNLWNQPIDEQFSTLLHYASKHDLDEIVWVLLEHGSDPAVKDKNSKFPYNLAPTKDCRRAYMRFQAEYPDKYDYAKAQVPGPLTKEMEQEKAEKQKALNKIKKEKDKKKKMEKKEKQIEIDEKNRFLGLSDREKRALAAEKRILGQAVVNGDKKPVLVRCFECATDITGKVPFEYNQNVFCTSKCLATHRKKFPSPLSI